MFAKLALLVPDQLRPLFDGSVVGTRPPQEESSEATIDVARLLKVGATFLSKDTVFDTETGGAAPGVMK